MSELAPDEQVGYHMKEASITRYFQRDHDRLDALFQQFQHATKTDPDKGRDCFQEFKSGLERHIAWEEDILFPRFEEKTGMRGTGPTEVMRMEHRQIKQLLEAIRQGLQQGTASDSDEAALVEILHAHNQKEEQILYPAIDELLTDQDRLEVFARMARFYCSDSPTEPR